MAHRGPTVAGRLGAAPGRDRGPTVADLHDRARGQTGRPGTAGGADQTLAPNRRLGGPGTAAYGRASSERRHRGPRVAPRRLVVRHPEAERPGTAGGEHPAPETSAKNGLHGSPPCPVRAESPGAAFVQAPTRNLPETGDRLADRSAASRPRERAKERGIPLGGRVAARDGGAVTGDPQARRTGDRHVRHRVDTGDRRWRNRGLALAAQGAVARSKSGIACSLTSRYVKCKERPLGNVALAPARATTPPIW